MSGGFGEATTKLPQSPSCSNSDAHDNSDTGDFECNICFDLAQDPIVTLCGHLFCWPCLYKWLHIHSHSQECPVCKALIEEEKLVPLYGRGKSSIDPRSKSIPGVEIPRRPAGQRPETAPPSDRNAFSMHDFGFMGGFGPAIVASFGNFTFSFGGFLPPLFNIHMLGFPGSSIYSSRPFTGYSYGGQASQVPPRTGQLHRRDFPTLSPILIIGLLFLLALIWE